MTSTALSAIGNGVEIDREAILKSLNLDVHQPSTQALLLVCERYGLDPLLKHMVLISGNPYITRDGYLAIAHRSGVFDGMEVLEQGADGTHFTARVAVYRKDMGRPFTFIGRYPKAQRMAKDYGPEMAVKVAEVQALRRAFNVTGVAAADERWDDVDSVAHHAPAALPPGVDPATGEVAELASAEDREAIALLLNQYQSEDDLKELKDAWAAARLTSFKAVDRFTAADAERAFELLADFQIAHPPTKTDEF